MTEYNTYFILFLLKDWVFPSAWGIQGPFVVPLVLSSPNSDPELWCPRYPGQHWQKQRDRKSKNSWIRTSVQLKQIQNIYIYIALLQTLLSKLFFTRSSRRFASAFQLMAFSTQSDFLFAPRCSPSRQDAQVSCVETSPFRPSADCVDSVAA